MAEPTDSYPESATLGAEKAATNGEDPGAAVDGTDELADILETAILVAATADDEDVAYLTDSSVNLVEAVDGLTTEEAAALATTLGDSADDVADSLEAVIELQREGHLEDLVDLATTLSALEIDADTARGLNTVLAAVGEAERTAEPVGLLGAVGALRTADGRAGLGYLVAILKAQGRRLRGR